MIALWYKIRNPLLQMIIGDFLNGTSVDGYDMGNPRSYRIAYKKFKAWLPVRRRQKKQASAPPAQSSTLDKYLGFKELPPLPLPSKLKSFRSAPQATYDDFAAGAGVPQHEWDMLRAFPKFAGYFEHMFEVNDLTFFDEVQDHLEARGVDFRNFFVHDVVAFELLRRQLGLADYAAMEKVAAWWERNPLAGIVHDVDYFPAAANISYVLRRVPAAEFVAYFHQLVAEGLALRVIKDCVLIWDGTFIRSNSNNNKNPQTGAYSDPDAGFARHIGKRLGVGYQPGLLYGYNKYTRRLPVHFKMFPGNRNDNPAFRATLGEFLPLELGNWKLGIVDTGAFSIKSLEFCSNRGIWPLIRARKDITELPTVELKPGYWFCPDWFPPGWTGEDVLEAYAWRPAVEGGIAEFKEWFNGGRLPVRGLEGATQHVALNVTLDWLRALTAHKMGRDDLTCKWSAFSDPRGGYSPSMWHKIASESGYEPFSFPGTTPKKGWKFATKSPSLDISPDDLPKHLKF
jgi:hypothetical protein